MVLRPTEKPMWAESDISDPISGQNNVLTPPPEKQNYGWAFNEQPPRNWFNWLGRFTYRWIDWLDQEQQRSQTALQTSYVIPVNVVDVINGGMALINAIDISNPASFFSGIAYIPPSMGVAATVQVINSNNLLASSIDTSGGINFAGGGVNVLISCVMKQIPS